MMLPNGVDWYPGTMMTLGELMRVFESKYLFRISRELDRMSSQFATRDDGGSVTPGIARALREAIEDLRKEFKPIGLDFTLLYFDRLDKTLQDDAKLPTASQIAHLITQISMRIEDELSLTLVLQVPKERADHYQKTDGFGADVTSRFPGVSQDVEEAYSCIALARYGGAVYHLMLVLEAGIQELAADLGVSDPLKKTWGELARDCREAVKKFPKGINKQQREEALNHLDGVRYAWRNPTMHPSRTMYTEYQALDILTNAKALMVSLAGFL